MRGRVSALVLSLGWLVQSGCGGAPAKQSTAPPKDGSGAGCPARAVTFPSADGLVIHATLAECAAGAPLVVLAHQMCKDRREWSDAAHDWTGRLHARGISTLAIDLRGHGESTTWPDGAVHDLCKEIGDEAVAGLYAAMQDDVTAAIGYARQTAQAIALAGASIGANSVIVAYARDPQARFAVALSPGLDYRNIKPEGAVVQLGTRPLLVEAARDDARSAAAVAEFGKLNPHITVKVWPEGGHGNSILAAHPEELERIIELLASHLR